ncbi:MAG: DUF4349 domain-containing protein [Armatimonadota bacterium]|nr:DUF4349 domain-containing protein [bacterium]
MTRTSRLAFAVAVHMVLLALFSSALLADTPAKIAVRSGSVVLKVNDYNQARSRIMSLARARKAVLHEEKSEANFSGERHGYIILELDAAQLGPMMEDVRGVGKLYSELVQTADQTSNFEKLGTQISLLEQNEDELKGFMRSPRRMRGSDILFVQYRLYESRVQAANAAQERANTARRAQRALINIALFEPEPRKSFDWGNWHAVASYRAKGSFLYVIQKTVTGFYYILYFAPFWIPALLIVFFGGRKLYRLVRQRVTAWLIRRRTANQEAV